MSAMGDSVEALVASVRSSSTSPAIIATGIIHARILKRANPTPPSITSAMMSGAKSNRPPVAIHG